MCCIHIETSHLIGIANQMTGSDMNYNIELQWVTKNKLQVCNKDSDITLYHYPHDVSSNEAERIL